MDVQGCSGGGGGGPRHPCREEGSKKREVSEVAVWWC